MPPGIADGTNDMKSDLAKQRDVLRSEGAISEPLAEGVSGNRLLS